MKQSTAIKVFGLFDLLGAATIWLTYHKMSHAMAAISVNAAVIEFDTRMYLGLFGAIPILFHLAWLIQIYLPGIYNRSMYSKAFYALFAMLILFGVGMTYKIKRDIKQNGYFYCEAASTHMNYAHFAVYVREAQLCEKLAQMESDHRP